MGAGGSASEPLSLEELRSLWNKHDSNGSGELERNEVGALLEDVRLRYGLDEPFPKDFVDTIFKQLDQENLGFWTWHDFRQLGGQTYFKIQKQLQRYRIQKGQKHTYATKKDERNKWKKVQAGGALTKAVFGADPAKARAKAEEAGEVIAIAFHPLRMSGLIQDTGAFFGSNPIVKVRIVRGNPGVGTNITDGRGTAATLASIEGTAITESEVAATDTKDDILFEDSLLLQFKAVPGLYAHVIFLDGINPLAHFASPLREIVEKHEGPRIEEFALNRLNPSAPLRNPVLVGQWGGRRPIFNVPIFVYRGENFVEDENLVVELTLRSTRTNGIIWQGKSESALGPHPIWKSEVKTDCNNEGNMMLTATVYISRGLGGLGAAVSSALGSEEAVGELASPIWQRELVSGHQAKRRPLRPLNGHAAGQQITIAWGVPFDHNLFVRARTCGGIAPMPGTTSFNPYVKALVVSQDPRHGMDACILAETKTETVENCTGDPFFKEPCILDVINEEGCYLRVIVVDDRERGVEDDDLAEVVFSLDEAYKLQKFPVEKKYDARLLVPKRRHDEPCIYLAFGEQGGAFTTQGQSSGLASDDLSRFDIDGDGKITKEEYQKATGQEAKPGAVVPQREIPPLAQLLQANGLAVPTALTPIPHAQMTLARPPPVAALEENNRRQERTQARVDAQLQGGVFRGAVPMSYFRNEQNPHAAWLFNPARR